MPATKRQIALDIVATDTHCGDGEKKRCPHSCLGGRCSLFSDTRDYELAEWEYIRLPECIAAEGAGQKGGDR